MAKSIDTRLEDLLKGIDSGRIQLPDFQRDWTWEDSRIRGLIASLLQQYPMGALMSLATGNPDVKFKTRLFTGVDSANHEPEQLILDGQQRLTTMYQAIFSNKPVETKNDKEKRILRYYYLDVNRFCDPACDCFDAIIAVPETRKRPKMFDQEELDLSTPEHEYKQWMFPLNVIFNNKRCNKWIDGCREYYGYSEEAKEKANKLRDEVVDCVQDYEIPVIQLGRETQREAVCKVFENVNTGGVSLTVFELVTATFAAENFDLREDWQKQQQYITGKDDWLQTDVLNAVDETDFLTAVTLYCTYLGNTMTTCKKKDVLSLKLNDYIKNREKVARGFRMAWQFLCRQCIFRKRDLPYSTQLIPLSAICAVIGQSVFNKPQSKSILERWFWSGIMGEMYGAANETRYACDIEDVVDEIYGRDSKRRTVQSASFYPTRLLTLQTRNSAAYKGIMALIYKERCRDFREDCTMDGVRSMDGNPDIHHIFPEAYCLKCQLPIKKWNSIVNKTPILPASNRSIGGDAPSVYFKRIIKETASTGEAVRGRIESHLINFDYFIANNFDAYFVARAKRLLDVISKAMGRKIEGRDSEDVIREFGESLEG